MKYVIIIVLLVSCLNKKVLSQEKYIGTYKIDVKKSKILFPGARIYLKENNEVLIKTFFHQIGWRVYKGKWRINKRSICIANLVDTNGIRPGINKLFVEINTINEVKDSIKIVATDIDSLMEYYPAEITINDDIKFKCKSRDTIIIKRLLLKKIKADFWGFNEFLTFNSLRNVYSIKLKLKDNEKGTANYYYKDIYIKIRNRKLKLSDGSTLSRVD